MQRVLVTGADGFIAKNLILALSERPDITIIPFRKHDDPALLNGLVAQSDIVFHLAGVNRTENEHEFTEGNADLAVIVGQACLAAIAAGRPPIPVVYTSSIQAVRDNPYGVSKRGAERALADAGQAGNFPVYLFRLPNVFGKWARPNYNSAVATFCHNISRGLPISVNDPDAPLSLVYIDDVVRVFIAILMGTPPQIDEEGFALVSPVYNTTVGALADQLTRFRALRDSRVIDHVGTGLIRALYATYVSYLAPSDFDYPLTMHSDARGRFVEVLRTVDSGQFSYFTARPGVTRGGHYHHSKTEKFVVISGQARFLFRHLITGEKYELRTSGDEARVVDTVPGWTHDITNIGDTELVVMLWANEQFNEELPDTYACPV